MSDDFREANARFRIEQGRLSEGICPNGCAAMVLVDSSMRRCNHCGQWEMMSIPGDSFVVTDDGFTQYADQV